MTTRPVRYAAVFLGGAAVAVGWSWLAPPAAPIPPAAQDDLADRGEELYQTSCVSCHGPEGSGVVGRDGNVRGPALTEAGEAGAFFFLASGRMPMATSDGEAVRKPQAFDDEEIDALVAYVASLGDGPALPEIDPEAAAADGGLGQGGVLYRENCQACHGAAAAGGALSYGEAAPSLGSASSEEVAAAVRIGPGQMPVFGHEVLDDDQLDQLVAYVEYLRDPDDTGGLPIGRTGPMPEGFVIWVVGIGALLLCVAWIGTRARVQPSGVGGPEEDET